MKNVLITLLILCGCSYANGQTRVYNMDKLAKVKAKSSSAEYSKAVKSLLSSADKALKDTSPSVMDKTMVADSGDKHDYMSMGPYWWPDPSKPDGLPYIRKDGQRNPELDKLDRNKLGNMSKAVTTLGLAYYFSNDERYARKAVDFLKVWFLNPATKMNPHLTYGQTIPGRNNGMGRGEGVIDIYSFVEMLDAIELMKPSKALTPEVQSGLKDWFTLLVSWMQTSPVASEERNAKNNHGLAYDVQLTAYALYTGNEQLARQIVQEFPERRLFKQIEPDGKQPLELARTTAFGYTVFNLWHMLDMSALASSMNMDVYHACSSDGRSFTAALKFLIPYIGIPQSQWPYQQIKEWNEKQDEACWILRRAAYYDPQAGYETVAARHRNTPASSRLYLLYSLE